jgi:hypothetical protein
MNWNIFQGLKKGSEAERKNINAKRQAINQIHGILIQSEWSDLKQRAKFINNSPSRWTDAQVNEVYKQLKKLYPNDPTRTV